ncbi:MAG: Gfo/Idh/MocA family oxidoreductase, partial [bacterium]|nr:Gfo/Idh/MocA family oxidoreductase [bacterium]
ESSKKAQGKTNFLVDFQTRNSPNFKECVSRVHRGDIGEIALGHVYYHAGRLGPQTKPGASDDENRLRNWVFDIKLSGDIIVEQNVHVLDVANWYLNSHPIKAVGTGGRKVRTDIGDCYDHFVVTYTYPNGATVDFSSAQFTKGYDDLCIRMYGSKGTADSHYAGANWGRGPVRIDGDNPWEGTERDNTWDAVDNNVKDFVQAFRSGEFINHGDYAVSSTLTGVLGRTAAYAQAPVTWDEMIKKNEAYEVDLQL